MLWYHVISVELSLYHLRAISTYISVSCELELTSSNSCWYMYVLCYVRLCCVGTRLTVSLLNSFSNPIRNAEAIIWVVICGYGRKRCVLYRIKVI